MASFQRLFCTTLCHFSGSGEGVSCIGGSVAVVQVFPGACVELSCDSCTPLFISIAAVTVFLFNCCFQ